MDKEEMIRAVRGALAAEIDAINYYLQQGKLFSDEFVKKVHDDIAKEEMTHFGEFLRLLYHLNKEEFDYIVKGWNEASKLIGENVEFPIKENNNTTQEKVIPSQTQSLKSVANVIKWDQQAIPVYELKVSDDTITQSKDQASYPLSRVNTIYKVLADLPKEETQAVLIKASVIHAKKEDMIIYKEHPLSILQHSKKVKKSDWGISGNIAGDIVKAYESVVSAGYTDVKIILPPYVYSSLYRVVDKTGTMEIELIKEIGSIYVSPSVDSVVVISKQVFYVYEGKALTVEDLGRDGEYEVYMLSSVLAPYILDLEGAVVLT
ncbi:ferritin [Sulfolobus sp. SCGC AB-777_L09]|nr:ferritin [Sulfolobus sp. SCGC AB-777_L09]